MRNSLTQGINSAMGAVALAIAIASAPVVSLGAQTPPPQQSPTPKPTPTPAPTIAGKWTMTLEMQMGTGTPTLDLVQQGEKITGTYEGRYGKSQLTGVLKNRVLEFSFTMNAEGTEVLMSFRGDVAADFKTMKGEADLGGMGDATWTAKRAEK